MCGEDFAYLVVAFATVHGLLTGTESDPKWALGLYAVAVGLVVSLTFWRIDSVQVAAAARAAQAVARDGVGSGSPGTRLTASKAAARADDRPGSTAVSPRRTPGPL
jgi:hypothetical protein